MIGDFNVCCKYRSDQIVGDKRKRSGDEICSSSLSDSSSSLAPREHGCEWTGPLNARQTHLNSNCGYAPVPCSFAAFGCGVRPQRRALAAHTIEAAPRHVELMATKIATQEVALAAFRAENKTLSTRLAHFEKQGSSVLAPPFISNPPASRAVTLMFKYYRSALFNSLCFL